MNEVEGEMSRLVGVTFPREMNEVEGEMSRLVGVPRSGHGNL